MKISDANLKIIFDSRGQETLNADLRGLNADLRGQSSVPSGKSKGTHEAFVLEPKLALQKFEEIKPQILNREFNSQEEFDNFLISLDGTQNKQNLGGNLILALSLSFARLKARAEGKELFQYIRNNFQFSIFNFQLPYPIFNVINGGAHSGYPKTQINADQNADKRRYNIRENLRSNPRKSAFVEFQEFQIIPEVKDFSLALGLGQEFYRKLKEFLEKKFGKENVFLGDEAGFSCPFKNNEEAIEILAEVIAKYHYPIRIGLDVAASQFYQQPANNQQQGYYLINGKSYSTEELKNYYLKLIEAYNILSIEDPFYEEDFDDFAKLTQNLTQNRRETLVIADDLTTTNPERLKTAINKKSGNAVLIKPNQIGTLTETLKVIKLAYENNWQTVVSHRSGETMDDFIADLAVAINAWGIKAGAPAAPERLAKYERILKIQSLI
jgi:enolase